MARVSYALNFVPNPNNLLTVLLLWCIVIVAFLFFYDCLLYLKGLAIMNSVKSGCCSTDRSKTVVLLYGFVVTGLRAVSRILQMGNYVFMLGLFSPTYCIQLAKGRGSFSFRIA